MRAAQREVGVILVGVALGMYLMKRRQSAKWALGAAAALAVWPGRRASFRNARVVITGGSRGLGLALARQFLAHGAYVSLWARDAEELGRAHALLLQERPDARLLPVRMDLTRGQDIARACAEVRRIWGGMDVLVNNAGAILVGPAELMSLEDYENQLAVHLHGNWRTMQAIWPEFRLRGEGHIINIASLGAKIPLPHLAPYCASKFALAGLSETVSAEWRRYGIRVTTVYPGLMRTGSAIQARFKGDSQGEYDWFSAADNAPGITVSADRAARKIVEAARTGRAQLIISWPARLATVAFALFPEHVQGLLSLVSRALPHGGSRRMASGGQVREECGESPIGRALRSQIRGTEERFNQLAKS